MQEFSIRVIVADDHPAILMGIKQEFSSVHTIELVDVAKNSTELISILGKKNCDVLVTDFSMPGGEYGDGLALLNIIQRRFSSVNIVVMTMMDNPAVLRSILTQGIRCIISKSDDSSHLIPAVHIAYSQGKYFSPSADSIIQTMNAAQNERKSTHELTRRESEVVRLYVSGLTINEVAERLHRSKQTISSQKSSAMKKLGIERDADLFRYAMELENFKASA